ncbi:hypothetical protein D3C78_1829830 [compost metagenome]
MLRDLLKLQPWVTVMLLDISSCRLGDFRGSRIAVLPVIGNGLIEQLLNPFEGLLRRVEAANFIIWIKLIAEAILYRMSRFLEVR